MRKSFLVSILVVTLLLLPWQSVIYASYGLNVIENDSIGVIYFNLGKAYNVLRDYLKKFETIADPDTKKQVEQMLSSMAKESPQAKDLSIAKIRESIEKWHNDAVFIPTGGVWISITKDLQPKVVIEAQIKPDKFADLLKSAPNSPGIEIAAKNNLIKFDIPGMNLPVEINSERIVIGNVPEKPDQLNEGWLPFYKRATSSGQHLSIELDVQAIIESVLILHQQKTMVTSEKMCAANMRVMMGATEMYNMDNTEVLHELNMDALVKGMYLKEPMTCPNGGTYSAQGDLTGDGEIACSIHNTVRALKKFDGPVKALPKINVIDHLPDPRLQHIARARLFADTEGMLLAIAIKDETSRQQFKEMLEQGLKMLEQQISQTKGDTRVETAKKLFASLKHIDHAPWLGLSVKQGENEQIMVGMAVVGVVAAIAIPNFQKARKDAGQRACFATQRVLMGAVEMYNMDNEEIMHTLNIEPLLTEKYLRSAPECLEGGTYSSEGDLAGDNGKIKCSVHGSID